MPLNRDDLAAACSHNDRIVDAGGSVPAILLTLGVDPTAAVYVAEQRALRVAMLHSGVTAGDLYRAATLGAAFKPKITKTQRDLIPVYAGVWTDGFCTAMRAYFDALTS